MSVADLSAFDLVRATSLDDLVALVAERAKASKSTVLLAGGTDFLVEQEMRAPILDGAEAPLLVDVSRLDALRGISLDKDRLTIGAATTYLEMERDVRVAERAPLLVRMGKDVGAVQIQARGTLGGNLATASPAADGVAALAAYDATIVVKGPRGERRIAFKDLQTGYKKSTRAIDEVIVAIEIDLPPEGSPWFWRKVGARRAQAISKVALAGVAIVSHGRCARFGAGMASAAPVTATLPSLRALALSKPVSEIDAAAIDEAVKKDVTPIDDVRSTGAYRLHTACAVARAWLRDLGARA